MARTKSRRTMASPLGRTKMNWKSCRYSLGAYFRASVTDSQMGKLLILHANKYVFLRTMQLTARNPAPSLPQATQNVLEVAPLFTGGLFPRADRESATGEITEVKYGEIGPDRERSRREPGKDLAFFIRHQSPRHILRLHPERFVRRGGSCIQQQSGGCRIDHHRV